MRRLLSTTVAALLALTLGACEETPTDVDVSPSSESMTNSNADFPVLHQGFNHDTGPWVDQGDEGLLGWCGTIEQIDRRDGVDPAPSAGRGYATVENGGCNEFYREIFGEAFTSAPASGPNPDLSSTTFPESGFVQQVDIYLDPAHPAGNETVVIGPDGGFALAGTDDVVFNYANSLCVLGDDGTCPLDTFDDVEFRYFAVPVTKNEGDLLVAGRKVEEAGWYTFRHVFGSDDGALTVVFELVQDGRPLFTESIENTLLTGEATSDFDVSDLGSGYVWFVSVADGLELPIDEHRLRPGS